MEKLIDAEEVCKEIDRFKGYLDEDMICRLKIAVKRLPTVEAIPKRWIKKWLGNCQRFDDSVYAMLKDWEEENE